MNPVTLQDGTQLDPKVVKVMSTLRKLESGGDYNAVGDNGTSFGAYQFHGSNWSNWAQQYLGDAEAPMTPANQNKLMYARISQQKAEGLQPEEIAALHNGATKVNGVYTYNNPDYGVKFRQALGQSQTPVATANFNFTGSNQPAPDQNANPGFFTEASNDIANRLNEGGTALSSAAQGQINPLSGLLQAGGAVAGGVTDLAADVLKRVPVVGSIMELGKEGIQKLMQTGPGQAIAGAVQNFSQAHPEIAGDIGAAGNIAGLIGLGKGVSLAKDAVGTALGKDALSSTIDDLTPAFKAGTKGGAKAVLNQGVEKSGITGAITLGEDPQARAIAEAIHSDTPLATGGKEVFGIPKFDSLPDYTTKLNAVDNKIGVLANQLRTNLSGEVQPLLTPDDLGNLEMQMKQELSQNPFVVGNPELSAQRIFAKFKSLLPMNQDITMNDVLDARQNLDQWIESQSRGNVFDPATENAKSTALRIVRQGANNIIADKVPDGQVKELLRQQSLFYRALDRLAPKAAKEVGTNTFTRTLAKYPLTVGFVKKGIKAAEGGAGLGVASHFLGN